MEAKDVLSIIRDRGWQPCGKDEYSGYLTIRVPDGCPFEQIGYEGHLIKASSIGPGVILRLRRVRLLPGEVRLLAKRNRRIVVSPSALLKALNATHS